MDVTVAWVRRDTWYWQSHVLKLFKLGKQAQMVGNQKDVAYMGFCIHIVL